MRARRAHDIESWCLRTGNLVVTLTAPRFWAAAQRAHLDEHLPPRRALPHRMHECPVTRLRADIRIGRTEVDRITETARTHSRQPVIETVPGVELQRFRYGGGVYFAVVADRLEGRPGAWAVRATPGTATLFLRDGSARSHHYPLRIIREVMMRCHENHGGLVMHAAAAACDGGGVLVCGPRARGKTTTLARMLRLGARLLSNDRVLLQHDDELVAVPLPVPLGRGTLDSDPELTAAAGRPAVEALPVTFASTGKLSLSPRAFAAALGSELAATAGLRLVVLPGLVDTRELPSVRWLTPREGGAALAECCFTPHDEFWLRPWLARRTATDAALGDHARKRLADVAKTVPAISVRFGVRNPVEQLDGALREALRGAP